MGAPIPDYSKLSLLLPMSGANGGTVFTDHSPIPKTVTRIGNAQTSTAQSKYYGSSGLFDGADDALRFDPHDDFRLSTGDYMMGGWVNSVFLAAYSMLICRQAYPSGLALQVRVTSARVLEAVLRQTTTVQTVTSGAVLVPSGDWAHFEHGRKAGTAYVAIGGVIAGSAANSFNLDGGSEPLSVGARIEGAAYHDDFAGNLQDVYVVKGYCRDIANFTPPPRLIGSIDVETRDESGILVPRKVFAVPRSYPSVVKASGTTDANGVATLTSLPACEYSVVAIADGDALPDLVLRRVPV